MLVKIFFLGGGGGGGGKRVVNLSNLGRIHILIEEKFLKAMKP